LVWKKVWEYNFDDLSKVGWEQTEGIVACVYEPDPTVEGIPLRLEDNQTDDVIKIHQPITTREKGKWLFEWKARTDVVQNYMIDIGRGTVYPIPLYLGVGIRTDHSTVNYILQDYTNGTERVTHVYAAPIRTGEFVKFKVELNMDEGVLNVYVNDTLVLEKYAYVKEGLGYPDRIAVSGTTVSGTGIFYVDAFALSEDVPAPPPVPFILPLIIGVIILAVVLIIMAVRGVA